MYYKWKIYILIKGHEVQFQNVIIWIFKWVENKSSYTVVMAKIITHDTGKIVYCYANITILGGFSKQLVPEHMNTYFVSYVNDILNDYQTFIR